MQRGITFCNPILIAYYSYEQLSTEEVQRKQNAESDICRWEPVTFIIGYFYIYLR